MILKLIKLSHRVSLHTLLLHFINHSGIKFGSRPTFCLLLSGKPLFSFVEAYRDFFVFSVIYFCLRNPAKYSPVFISRYMRRFVTSVLVQFHLSCDLYEILALSCHKYADPSSYFRQDFCRCLK